MLPWTPFADSRDSYVVNINTLVEMELYYSRFPQLKYTASIFITT